jgi:hypothetical protein
MPGGLYGLLIAAQFTVTNVSVPPFDYGHVRKPSLEASCGKPEEIKALVPDYSEENQVASYALQTSAATGYIVPYIPGRVIVRTSLIRVYNSKLKTGKKLRTDIDTLLRNGDADVVAIHEEEYNKTNKKPTAVFYKNQAGIFLVLYVEPPVPYFGEPQRQVYCLKNWSSKVISEVTHAIQQKRIEDAFEIKDAFRIKPPKLP